MTDPLIYSLAPAKINSTVLAVGNLRVSPAVAKAVTRHSGNEFPSIITIPGAAPRVRFQTPFGPAYTLLGLKALEVTTLDVAMASFAAGLRQTSGRKFGLSTNATAFVYIRSVAVPPRGIAWAEIECVYLSADGLLHPVTPATATLPVLAAEPQLHTAGPSSLNGTVRAGAVGFTFDLNSEVVDGINGEPGDGLLYPTVAQYLGGAPSITVEHGDPVSILTDLGLVGANISANAVHYLRAYDATTQLALATGLILTIANGRITPLDFGADSGRVATTGYVVDGLSVGATHPIVITTGAIPTP